MITVKGRELMIPPMERNIGTTYDESAEVRIFRIDRVTAGGIDLSHLNFRLDLEYQGEKKDSSLLAVEVREDSILLTWTIRHSCVATAGTVWIAIRGYDDNGTVKWATNKGAVYAKDTIDTPGSNPPGLTELEQLERRIDEKTETLDAHEGERQQNEVIRQENEQKRQNNEAGWQRQAETAIGQANTTLQGANAAMEAAQGSATSAAESAAAANASKEAAAGSASAAEESAAEAQRISQGFAGFDGTAESVPAVDVQGLVVQAGSASNVQALLNYLAVKVAQELVSNEALTNKLLDYMLKSSIVQTESTDPTTVPSSPYFKQVTDKLTSDLGNHLIMFPDGATATQSKNGNVWRRLQVQMINDDIAVFKSTDNGKTWPEVKTLLTNSVFSISGMQRAELFYDDVNGWPVIKWFIRDSLIYQLVLLPTGANFDRWDGTNWVNIWHINQS